jgi:DNA-binding NarL/FixJ family response regulator
MHLKRTGSKRIDDAGFRRAGFIQGSLGEQSCLSEVRLRNIARRNGSASDHYWHIGRRPLDIDRVAVLQERARGQSLSEIAETHRISRATVSRLLNQAKEADAPSL